MTELPDSVALAPSDGSQGHPDAKPAPGRSATRVLASIDGPRLALAEGRLDLIAEDLKQRGDVANGIIAHNDAQAMEICDGINVLQHGRIVFDKPTAETSVVELTELVIAEYRGGRRHVRRETA